MDILLKTAFIVVTIILIIIAVFAPAELWFRLLPFLIALIAGHTTGYCIIKFILFRNKIKLCVNHVDFLVFAGPAIFTSLIILLILRPVLVAVNIPINEPILYDWNLFLATLILSLNTMPVKIVVFTVVYIVAGFMYSNPKKAGVFKHRLYLNPKEEVMKGYVKKS